MRLGVRLLNRTTRSLGPTEAGDSYYTRAKQILEAVDEAEDALAGSRGALTGSLRIQAPVGFGQLHLAPIVIAFHLRHPELKVELILDDQFADLIEGGVDVAIRFGALKPSGLIVRKLGVLRRVLVASPDYVAKHGSPETPEELTAHAHVRFSWAAAGDEVPLIGPEGFITVPVRSNFQANNAFVLMAALRASAGVGAAQVALVHDLLEDGSLVQVMRRYAYAPADIHAVYPSGRFVPRKVRTFVDHITAELRKIPGLE